jgi:site-specific recombinase XerD
MGSGRVGLPFLDKLREKNQTSQQQKQASDAISIFYEIGTPQSGKYFSNSNKKYFISERQNESKPESANWKPVYDDLTAEIKLRHYSPKTLKAYTGCARHLIAELLYGCGLRISEFMNLRVQNFKIPGPAEF